MDCQGGGIDEDQASDPVSSPLRSPLLPVQSGRRCSPRALREARAGGGGGDRGRGDLEGGVVAGGGVGEPLLERDERDVPVVLRRGPRALT
jgi:hypothetical protein